MQFVVRRLLLAAAILATSCLVASADSVGQVYVSLGPNANLPTPSYSGYTTNAQNEVRLGAVPTGYPVASPTQFSSINNFTITPGDMTIDNNFNNWRGSANPTGSFANEYGTMLYFSVAIYGNPGQNDISLSQVTFTTTDTDSYMPPNGYFGDVNDSFTNYASDAVGIDADGVTMVTSGDPSQAVNEIILTGYAISFDASGYSVGTDQDQLDTADSDAALALGPFTVTTCYSLAGDPTASCGSVNVAPAAAIPEPASFAIVALSLAGIPFLKRRLRKAN